MRHLKNFRTWLSYVFCAVWALSQQGGENNQYRIFDRAAERLPDNASAIESEPVESESALAPSIASSGKVESASDDPSSQTILAAAPKQAAVLPPSKKKLEKSGVTDKERIAPQAEPSVAVMPVAKMVAKPASPATVAAPQPSAPQRVLQKPKGKGSANVSASAARAASGKYDPAAINDETAKRLARLLVSEIKLYYMSATNGAGATEGNIYDMLKDPIDKSRQHYKQRMGATVETMPDYFHGELVRSLCGGDASRLGPNYQPVSEKAA